MAIIGGDGTDMPIVDGDGIDIVKNRLEVKSVKACTLCKNLEFT